ncbi:MAG TPA: minor capsid protein, partial [Ramlibacter sp.]|nr:minor capsid protein [Ramlibacter sp.]
AHQVLVERFSRGLVVRTASRAERTMLEEIAALIARRGQDMPRGQDFALDRRAAFLLRAVREIVRAGAATAKRQLVSEARDFAVIETRWLRAAGRSVFGVDWNAPAPNLVQAAMDRQPMMGRRWGEWFTDWVPRATERAVVARVQAGMVAGETTPQIVRGLQGMPATQYRDGTLAVTRRALQTMARTVTTHVAGQARQLSFQQNADVVPRVRWLATLDLRTTRLCASLDGTTWAVDEPHPVPPAHPNCRSSLIPSIGPIIGKRASMDGPVPADTTFEEWIRQQSLERQEAVFGKTLAREFAAGRITVADMVDRAFTRPLTLKEMRDLDLLGL